jgi:hypothetical protein
MATNTVLLEKRLYVAGEIDLGRNLRTEPSLAAQSASIVARATGLIMSTHFTD